jgi:hypothetical protein
MRNNPKSKALVVLTGALLVMSPLCGQVGGIAGSDSAYAKNNGDHGNSGSHGGGGDHGGGGSHGNSGSAGSGHGNSASASNAGSKKSFGTGTKLTGPLAATHASATAFLHAASNSRVGEWKAYYTATVLADGAASLADGTDAQALMDAYEASAPTDVIDAYTALQEDPTNPDLIDAFNQAVTDNGLTATDVAAIEQAYSDYQDALAADQNAATLQDKADALLLTANNNRPVDDATRALLDQTLAAKLAP